jgi:hypothetical protein
VALVVLLHRMFLDPSHFHYRSKRIRNYALGVSFSGMTHMSDFFQNLSSGCRVECRYTVGVTIRVFIIFFHVSKQRISWLIWSPLLWAERPHTHLTHKPIWDVRQITYETSHHTHPSHHRGVGVPANWDIRESPIVWCYQNYVFARTPMYLPFSKQNTVY